jgi:hypothetical protein
MPVQMIELEEVQMVETTDESLELAGVVGGGLLFTSIVQTCSC